MQQLEFDFNKKQTGIILNDKNAVIGNFIRDNNKIINVKMENNYIEKELFYIVVDKTSLTNYRIIDTLGFGMIKGNFVADGVNSFADEVIFTKSIKR